MQKIATLIHQFSKNRFVETYPPCDKDVLSEQIRLLVEEGLSWTEELSRFYLISNGFYYNGITIFSIDGTSVPDLLDKNQLWNIADRLPGCVLFGRSDEEVYVYNQPENKYQILDFTGWDEYYSFDSLAGLFEFVVNERL